MARSDINRLIEMEVFVSVAESGSFSASARARRMTPSAVSKTISRLEDRLGTRLINRNTRKIQLTPEGSAFYERCRRILADLDEAEHCVSAGEVAFGHLRVTVNIPVGTRYILPVVSEFLALYPRVTLDISLTDQVVDLLDDRADVAIRSGPMKASNLVSRKLGQTRMLIVGAPEYLHRMGEPKTPQDLSRHRCIRFNFVRAIDGWPLMIEGVNTTLPITGNLLASDGESIRTLALSGAGLARIAEFMVRDDIAARRLQPVLGDYQPEDVEEVHAVFLGQGGKLPVRVRAFLDFLYNRVRID